MTIGSLFIALGFKISGRKEFDDADRGLTEAAGKAVKLTLAVNAVNWALLAMMDTAAKAGMALKVFSQTTDLSTDNLQFWQHAAVTAGVGADVLTAKIKQLQDVRSSFALGEPQNVGAWALLGVDPRQDPFEVVKALRKRLAGVSDIGVARNLLGKVGLEELLPLLRATNNEFSKWERNFIMTGQQTDRLARLNAAWESLKRSVASVRNQFAASLAPMFEKLARLLEFVARGVAVFTQWLSSNTAAATSMRYVLAALVVVLLAVGVTLAVITAALGALAGLFALMAPALIIFGGALGGIVLVVGALAAALVFLFLLFQDFHTAAMGGKSYYDWNKGLLLTIDNVDRLARAIQTLINLKNILFAATGSTNGSFLGTLASASPLGGIVGMMSLLTSKRVSTGLENMATAQAGVEKMAQQVTNQTTITIPVSGAQSPEATARAVGRELGQVFRGATVQAPARNY